MDVVWFTRLPVWAKREAACVTFQRSCTCWGHCMTHTVSPCVIAHKVLLSWLTALLRCNHTGRLKSAVVKHCLWNTPISKKDISLLACKDVSGIVVSGEGTGPCHSSICWPHILVFFKKDKQYIIWTGTLYANMYWTGFKSYCNVNSL